MNTDLSEVNDYWSLQDWLDDYCQEAKHDGWHNYGPADLPTYLSDPVRILLMGAESGGYEWCPKTPPDEYIKWIRGNEWTPRNGSVFVAVIREYIALLLGEKPVPQFDRSRFAQYYQDVDLLVEKMRGTIYMNARVTSNDSRSSREDKGGIWSDINEFAPYRRQFIQVLRPRIVICAGASARESLFIDGGAFPSTALRKERVFPVDNCIVVMARHLSRFGGYRIMHEIAFECASMYAAKDWSDN